MKTIKVGTRGSKLAKIQTANIVSMLSERFPDVEFETVIISSVGDRIQDRPIEDLGGNGVFTSEIERTLIGGEIDFAVHSMKDLPSVLPEGLCLSPSPRRADPRDALVLSDRYGSLDDLPAGARIGTGSIRRTLCLSSLRPDIETVPIRGNVDTRLGKVGNELDGVVLAAAGLIRAGYGDRITQYFSTDEMVPAPAQGILALELRADDKELFEMLSTLRDEEADISARAERAFLRASGVGCHAPVGAYCGIDGDRITLKGLYGADNAEDYITGSLSGFASDAERIGQRLAEKLLREYGEKHI